MPDPQQPVIPAKKSYSLPTSAMSAYGKKEAIRDPANPQLSGQTLKSTLKPGMSPEMMTMFSTHYGLNPNKPQQSTPPANSPLSRPPRNRPLPPKTSPMFSEDSHKQLVADADKLNSPFYTAHIKKMESTVKDPKTGRLVKYPDPGGGFSIGYGHLLNADEIKSGFVQIGAKKINFKNGLSEDEAHLLLEQDSSSRTAEAAKIARQHGINWDALPPQAQTVAADLAYQVGPGGFKRYKPLLAAMREEDWAKAQKHVKRFYRDRNTGKMTLDKRRTLEAQRLLAQIER